MKKGYLFLSAWLSEAVVVLAMVALCGCGKGSSKPSSVAPPLVPIHTAVTTGNLEAVRQHIAAGSDLNQPDVVSQSTPLMNAIVFGNTEIAEALVEAGADLDARSNDGSTALITAAFFGHPEIVQRLLDNGADPTLVSNAGATALTVVTMPWQALKPAYDMVGGMLAPAGLVLDYDRIQSVRPEILTILGGEDISGDQDSADYDVSADPDFEVETIVPTGEEQYLNRDSDYIFDQNRLPTFELQIPGSAYAKLDADPAAEEYVEGRLTFEGETISPVGIRYKGSVGAWSGGLSSFNPMAPSGHKIRTKLSMKVKFNSYGPDKKFYGLNKLQFHSQNLDPSQMHERLGYWLFREMGVAAPRSVHARLVINGRYAGLYALTEQIDGQFARHHFADGEGNVYKEVWPLNADGQAHSEATYLRALKTNEDTSPDVQIIKTFAEELSAAPEDQVSGIVEQWMDLNEILALIAVDRAIRNDDGPFHWYCSGRECMNHNYYWYEDPTRNRLHLIPWDLDNAFENIISDVNPVTPIADRWGEVSRDCEPFGHGLLNIPQRSAACDKLTRGWARFEQAYADQRDRLFAGPLSKASTDALLNTWAQQIRAATVEASETHRDAITPAVWEQALRQLKDQLDHARKR